MNKIQIPGSAPSLPAETFGTLLKEDILLVERMFEIGGITVNGADVGVFKIPDHLRIESNTDQSS